MAALPHGNSGYNVKNLKATSGCPHYCEHAASLDSKIKCAVNLCSGKAIRACHVVSSNQNSGGARKLVYMCPAHNALYDVPLSIRLNASTVDLSSCTCGRVACAAMQANGARCDRVMPCGYHSK